ncbi:MAG: hypothetical protein A2511_05370 [Deltaproteobacteria bacterium RIFOXYD12_FULL_50_9]|nr:MAG: hypothetical protein A2511_05370 [Deltaproteobacteria bacterium RIFOXYD12_FULL_50_9]
MPLKNGKYFNLIAIQSIDNTISSVNKLSNVRITYFWNSSSTSRIVGQNCFSMVNKGINKPDRTIHAITCNELLYINQIIASFL